MSSNYHSLAKRQYGEYRHRRITARLVWSLAVRRFPLHPEPRMNTAPKTPQYATACDFPPLSFIQAQRHSAARGLDIRLVEDASAVEGVT